MRKGRAGTAGRASEVRRDGCEETHPIILGGRRNNHRVLRRVTFQSVESGDQQGRGSRFNRDAVLGVQFEGDGTKPNRGNRQESSSAQARRGKKGLRSRRPSCSPQHAKARSNDVNSDRTMPGAGRPASSSQASLFADVGGLQWARIADPISPAAASMPRSRPSVNTIAAPFRTSQPRRPSL